MHRFFVEKDSIIDNKIEIRGTDLKHIKDVLRLKPKDGLEVSSEGIIYTCEIEDLSNEKIILNILDSFKGKNEAPISINLFQSLAKGSKMDLILQKCTEIGVKEFYPVMTHRTIVKINNDKKEDKKVQRWRNIVDEAAKQSKRDILPMVHPVITFNEMIELLRGKTHIIVPYEDERANGIKDCLKTIKGHEINLIIGPEGGFEPSEIEVLKSIGAYIVTLGPRILRTETAGMVAATIILYELGDLGVIQ